MPAIARHVAAAASRAVPKQALRLEAGRGGLGSRVWGDLGFEGGSGFGGFGGGSGYRGFRV